MKLEFTFDTARSYGDVFALRELWKDLGFDRAIDRSLRSGRRKLDIEALVRAMVSGPAIIRAKMPLSLHRFQRLQRVMCGPYSPGASRHRKPLRLMKIIPLGTLRLPTRGLP